MTLRNTLTGLAALTLAAAFAGGALADDKPMAKGSMSTGAMAAPMKSDGDMKTDSMKKPMKKKATKKAMGKDEAMAKDGMGKDGATPMKK